MKKPKRPRLDPVIDIYRSVTEILPLPSTTNIPGSPSSFFHKSYKVCVEMDSNSTSTILVHCHANGLCVLTLPPCPSKYSNLCAIDYLVSEPPERSVTERRKRQSALLSSRGGSVDHKNTTNKKKDTNTNSSCSSPCEDNSFDGVVLPSTPLVQLTWEDGTVESICAGIWGIIIERNHHLTPELIQRDAALDGYLAIIQTATGSFPPRSWSGPSIVPQSVQGEENS
jgi:hypothetical protein